MEDTRSDLEARVEALEQLMHRLLLIVGAAGAMLSEVRRDEDDT
jgi:hypothetical protein